MSLGPPWVSIHYKRRGTAFTNMIMLMPGLCVAPKLPTWGILMYFRVFFVVVTTFYAILYGIDKVRPH
jgi:hypothetical protein